MTETIDNPVLNGPYDPPILSRLCRRIDVQVGSTIFEVKRDLRPGNVLEDAVAQFASYVATQAPALWGRYVGVLTDGREWCPYHPVGATLREVSSLVVDPPQPDKEPLHDWLVEVVATLSEVLGLLSVPHHIAGAC